MTLQKPGRYRRVCTIVWADLVCLSLFGLCPAVLAQAEIRVPREAAVPPAQMDSRAEPPTLYRATCNGLIRKTGRLRDRSGGIYLGESLY